MVSRPLIKESLLLLNVWGIEPHKRSTWNNTIAAASLTILLVILFNLLLELNLNWKGLESMQVITVFVGIYQITFKFVLILIYRKKLVNVIKKFTKFWPVERCSVKLQEEIESTYSFVRKSMKLMVVLLLIILLTFFPIPILQRELPIKTYYPVDLNRSPDYEIAVGVQILSAAIACTALCGADGLFVSLIINIISELKILREGFRRLPIDHKFRGESWEALLNLYRMIDHHTLISQCINDIRDIYSIFLLNVYFYSMVCIGVGLLSIISTGFPPSLESLSQFGTLVMFYAIQLFFYCATGSNLITESESLATVVYNTNWWVKTQPELRSAYVLIIMRANKAEALTAGGMFTLNLDSFTKVIRSTLSLFTLVEAIYKP